MTLINAVSAWIVKADGTYTQMSQSDWKSVEGTVYEFGRGVYIREDASTLIKVFDNVPPDITPSSVVASDAGAGNELSVTWSTVGVHASWEAQIQYFESVPAFNPGDPPVITLRETEIVAATGGGAVSTYQFLTGQQAFAEVRFKMGTGYGGTATSNTVTF